MRNKEFILITGSSGKLGKTICEIFAERGENIIFHYFNSQESTNLLINKFNKKYKNVQFEKLRIDLSNLYSVHFFREKIFKKYQIKGLVNNASIFVKDKGGADSNFLNKNMNIHYRNPLALISCMVNSDVKGKFIINVTDINLEQNGYHSYNKSKYLLSEFSKNMIGENTNLNIIEYKPGKILPSKNAEKSLIKFKQEFKKLIE